MSVVLYHWPISPPPRTVLAVSKAIWIDATCLNIGGHVIPTYLVSRYGKDDSLCPKDLKMRALVDQRLYFNATALFPRIKNTTTSIIFFGKRSVDADAKAAIYKALGILEKYLEPTGWVAGDRPTVADISCSVSTGRMKVRDT
ncbi:glutathione S-transferase 1-like [Schistocerca serialis cubense]|uniref:glutathione S-transferase 1-like n=1 Tax=Schistocerca serialis cubense TaxID=2023355 RepID=UPI00214E2429|nr:glutathione S-transferase 1-like [Schistocerca serialis cubense]